MTKNLTEGRPLGLIIRFAIPLFLGMLFQQFYNMVDTIIVGNFLGLKPLAGVGATGSINFMVLGFCMGICSGFAIPIAQSFGAGDEGLLRKYLGNSIWLCVFFGGLITVLSAVLCSQILRLMNTPEDIFTYSYHYLVIIFCGIPFTILYNMAAGVFRSLGDSRTPLMFLIFSSLINIVLDLAFVLLLHMGVEGPAYATVISQGISGIASLFYMKKHYPIVHLQKEDLRPDAFCIRNLAFVGIPMGLQYSVTAIGSLMIQTAINGFGSTVVAGVTAANKIHVFLCCPFDALGSTMASFAGQNTGARRTDRVQQGMIDASLIGFGVAIAVFGVVTFFGRNLITLFLDEPNQEVIFYGYRFLHIASACYILLVLVNVVRFTIQGMGYSALAITAGFMEMIARVTVATLGVAAFGFTAVCFGHFFAWVMADLFLIPAFFYCKHREERQYAAKNSALG